MLQTEQNSHSNNNNKMTHNLNELTMQSRLMTEEEARAGKESRWFRLTLSDEDEEDQCLEPSPLEGPVKNLSANIGNLTYITTLVIKNNNLTRLPPEIGNLVKLINFDASHNALTSLPRTIGNLTGLRAFLLNDNQLTQLPYEFGLLINLKVLHIIENPLTQELRNLLGDGSDIRPFLRQHNDWYYMNLAFTLMCYNVLCPMYATQAQYPYCPTWALQWDYRRRAILEEIRTYNASIICLQELETSQFYETFKPELQKIGYDAVFISKSRRRNMNEVDGKRVDGCAIFWQVDKFEKLHVFHHEFGPSCTNVCEQNYTTVMNRVVCRDNVAVGVIFETKIPPDASSASANNVNRHFCVTTGHIHWDPDYSDVKLIQTILWVNELWTKIDQFLTGQVQPNLTLSSASSSPSLVPPASSRSRPLQSPVATVSTPTAQQQLTPPGPQSASGQMPVIFCGDLNSLPSSGVTDFLSNGSLSKSHVDFRNNGFKYMLEQWPVLERSIVDGDTVRHRFNFDRAYQPDQGMAASNYTFDFKGMIDYIYFTRDHFRLLGSLDQVTETWFHEQRILGCPHVHYPSDHFSLLAELELKPTPTISALIDDLLKRGGAGTLSKVATTPPPVVCAKDKSLSSSSTTTSHSLPSTPVCGNQSSSSSKDATD